MFVWQEESLIDKHASALTARCFDHVVEHLDERTELNITVDDILTEAEFGQDFSDNQLHQRYAYRIRHVISINLRKHLWAWKAQRTRPEERFSQSASQIDAEPEGERRLEPFTTCMLLSLSLYEHLGAR